jgi:hypothetical protein
MVPDVITQEAAIFKKKLCSRPYLNGNITDQLFVFNVLYSIFQLGLFGPPEIL